MGAFAGSAFSGSINNNTTSPSLHMGIANQHIGLSLKTNLSYKGATNLKLITNKQILTSNPDDINKIGYNKSGTNLLSFNLAPDLVSDEHMSQKYKCQTTLK